MTRSGTTLDIFADLVAEQDRLEAILQELDDDAWTSPSAAEGWTVSDVVLHLAQTDEAVVVTIGGLDTSGSSGLRRAGAETLDDAMDRMVRAERAESEAVFGRWQVARRAAVAALQAADPDRALPWASAPLKPTTLATTRLAEHWAHGLDITGPLDLAFPDTERLRHVAWLAHGSLPYAFALHGLEPHEVRCELTAPDGSAWRYGPPDAPSAITGSGGAFCRVGAQRLTLAASGLVASGPHGAAALRVLRTYAG